MCIRDRFYSILIVSATDSFTSALTDLVSETRYRPVHNVTSISAAKRILAEKTFDFIIINSPLYDDAGIRFAIDTCAAKSSAVLLLLKNDIHADVHDKVVEYGIFTLSKPCLLYTSYELFDIYEGSQIKEGYKSMAYSVVFRNHDKTLEESEINAVMKKILNGLTGLGIELRS